MPGLHHAFAAALEEHGYGWALYEPELLSVLNPGCCGIIADDGSWSQLFRIDDAQGLRANGLDTIANLVMAPSSTRAWGPKISSAMQQRRLELHAEVDLLALGIPANFGAVYAFQSSRENASILLAESPIQKDGFQRSEPIKTWMAENAKRIASLFPEIKTKGLIVVTGVYHTAKASTNIVRSSGQSFRVGFEAGTIGIGEVAPSTSWAISKHDSGWVETEATTSGDPRVVIFSGLLFKWRAWRPTDPKLIRQSKWAGTLRGAEHYVVQYDDKDTPDGPQMLVECEAWGADANSEHPIAHEKFQSTDQAHHDIF